MTTRLRLMLLGTVLPVLIAGPASAGTYGPVQVVTPDACNLAHVVGGSSGVLRGFASCDDGRVMYLQRQPGAGWARSPSTYAGEVAAVADDGQNVFVLLTRDGQVGIARRTHGGRELPWRSLHTTTHVTAGLVARAGHWWAVWSSYVAPGSSPPHLWQAGTLLDRTQPAVQITFGGSSDVFPRLAIGPRGRLVLTWARQTSGPSTARLASTSDGRWVSRQLSSSSPLSAGADLVADEKATTVAVGETRGNTSSVRVIMLPAEGGTRTLLRQYGVADAVLGGTSSLPIVGYVSGSGQHPTFVIKRRSGNGFTTDSVTFPSSGEDAFSGQVLRQIVLSGGRTTLMVEEQRQSGPDPQTAQNASRLLSRSS